MSEYIHPYSLPDGDEQRRLHLERYNFARDVIRGSVVANAACSTNYGWDILKSPGRFVLGFDRNDAALACATSEGRYFFVKRDIQGEVFDGFDTLVCLETFEHLQDPWGFLKNLSPTVKELVLSTPCIPTKHFNEWHLHDFTAQEVIDGLEALGWTVQKTAYQDESPLPKPTYILLYATR